MNIARNMYKDSMLWPPGHSKYYYGQIPKVSDHIPRSLGTGMQTQLVMRIASAWHTATVRTTGRLWGRLSGHETGDKNISTERGMVHGTLKGLKERGVARLPLRGRDRAKGGPATRRSR